MCRFGRSVAIAALFLCPVSAAAAESKLGAVVGQTKDGAQVSTVASGGVAGLMGFKRGDFVKQYQFDGKARPVTAPKDMDEFLTGKPGKYKIVVRRDGRDVTIEGEIVAKPDLKDPKKERLIFVPAK
ncbi:MAG: hypothetical protein FJ304_26285 [Planctomycetes bacterium]|nr:hypothetical protein [Planctomycetota bacterium]